MTEDERLIRQMAEVLGAVFWVADADEPHILYVSDAYEQIWGRDRQRLYTHYDEFLTSVHPDDRERMRSTTSRGVLQEQFEAGYRIVRPDGEVRWIRDRGFLIRDQNGVPDRIAGFAEDVTDRNRTETALRVSEAKYRSLFNSIDEGFCIIERVEGELIDFRYVEVNPAFALQTGISDIAGKTVRQTFPDAPEAGYEIYENVLNTGESIRFEIGVPSIDRVLELYAFRIGAEPRLAVIFKDISDRKRTETNLAFLAEISQDLAHLTGIDETMNVIGAEIGQFFGVQQCIFAEHADEFETSVVAYGWSAGDASSLKGTYRMRDFLLDELVVALLAGEPLIVSETQSDARVSAERYGALNIRSFIIIPLLRDREWRFQIAIIDNKPRQWRNDEIDLLCELTTRIWTRLERARAEAALRESEEQYRTLTQQLEQRVQDRTTQLQALNHELEAFSRSISHDLKTPLNYITMMAGLLPQQLDSTQLNETSLRYLNIIAQSATYAGAMVDDLLEFSQMGRAEMRWITVQMNPLVQQVQQQLQPNTIGRSIDWQIEPLPDVQGDAAMLCLVWQNLLSNAIKYSRDRSTATVTIGSRDRDNETVFFVQDNGAGFDMKYHDRLFGIFQRLHPQEQFDGTGVGLANVRRIIHRHGGRTWAEGAIDQGATIYFSLPKQQEQT